MHNFTARWGVPITNLDEATQMLHSFADRSVDPTEVDTEDIAAACTIVLQRLKRLEDRLKGKQLPFRPSLTKEQRAYQRAQLSDGKG